MNTLEINQKKVIETKALLLDIIKEPSRFKEDDRLRPALKSQNGLAKYTNIERGIASCTLNTLKSASEPLLVRGFTELDELRNSAKDTIESAILGDKATKSTRTGLRNKIDKLEAQLSTMQKSDFLLTVLITELRGELKKMAHSSDSSELRRAEYHRINRIIEAKLSYTLHGKT
ncbi:hypothetical protein PE36_17675 [Moritella sp. PE36]|uniref:hypothetical protein n=1 Tax=Moritella sp. PE36 TaxID=58051 RepID=UPI0001568228|nr:hypothetical protein [Moritella sp. PE36]EDM67818.1 hypothetical protein PE36_17675 [Moritella sp. PE36]